jgi:RNA polymerase sigma-70 factor (ECF subfamily)
VARSTTVDALRRRRLRETPLDERTAAEQAAPSSAPPPAAIPAGLLSARQELVLKLLFDEERDVRDVARLLAVDEQTVRSTKHKALTALRRHFGVEPARRGMLPR